MKTNTKENRAASRLAEKLALLLKALEQGVEPALIEIKGQNPFTEAMIVVGATSRRHAQGLADAVGRVCSENRYEFLGMEGYDSAQWILVDCNDVVVNIFQEDARRLYKLEELWSAGGRGQLKEVVQ